MINHDCPICFGIGWVCENHPNRAWDEQKGYQCGAGMPCKCQRASGLEEPDISEVIEKEPAARNGQPIDAAPRWC
jgi:hypothetical protein